MVSSCCLKVGGDLNPFSFSFYFLAFYCCCFEFSGPFVFAFDNKSDSRDDIAPFEICCAFRFWRKPESTFIFIFFFESPSDSFRSPIPEFLRVCVYIYCEDDEKKTLALFKTRTREGVYVAEESYCYTLLCVCVLLLQSIRLRTAARNQPSNSRGWDSVSIRTFGKW
jgi:hypothetical protein